MNIWESIVKWLFRLLAVILTGYYQIAKFLLKISNQYITLVDYLIFVIGLVLSFLAEHIFAVLIALAFGAILFITYKIVIQKNSGDKE